MDYVFFARMQKPQSLPLRLSCGQSRIFGRSGEAQTRGLRIPNAARYQLRYTPIVIKLWSCKWSNLWSNTFLTAFFFFRTAWNPHGWRASAVGTDKRQKCRLCSQMRRAINCATPRYIWFFYFVIFAKHSITVRCLHENVLNSGWMLRYYTF